VALGRIGDARGRGRLQGLLVDSDAAVRRAAAFALGELGAKEARPNLLRAAVDDDAETGTLAVEALGKIETPLAEVRRVLGALDPEEGDRRLAPFLFRFPGDDLVEAASTFIANGRPEARRGAVYALARLAPPAGMAPLRPLLADPEPRLRAWAARGLGEAGELADLARLEPLLADPDPAARIQALRAGAKILSRTSAIAPLTWGDRIAELVRDPVPGVRATALEAAPAWLGSPATRAAVLAAVGNGEPRERELALLALCAGGDEEATTLVERAAGGAEPFLRARAAECAGRLGRADLANSLAADREPVVRVAALSTLLELSGEADPAAIVRPFLADPDPAVRTTALDALAERPALPVDELLRVLAATASDRLNDARLASVRALAARAKSPQASVTEAAAASEALARLATDRDSLVRREAANARRDLGVEPPAVGPVETGKTATTYALVLEQTERPRYVAIETERGRLTARLDCPQAPLTCLSFLQLAEQGYFDGMRFHRVVPDFVVQAGDPRGDGWGGPGYALRDEINRLRYQRGAVGMALSGPDTGGSQFFVTLSPQPHLDGGYTVFGAIVDGEALLDVIRQGDRLVRIREVAWNE
jgi:cyclophilin family peptidyl-prolyl cis-trans isomerase/HEAT repeat protein